MPIFGITASSNMSTKLTDFYQIATTTVGAGGASSVEFTSIPQDYTHLQVRFTSRSAAAVTADYGKVQFNNDTTAVYANHYFGGTGASTFAGANINSTYSETTSTPGTSRTANVFDAGVYDILDYANTNKFKTARMLYGWDANGTGEITVVSNLWRSTAAITSIKFFGTSGNYSQYTSFALYGIKG
jgi:hypothetical protein